MRLKKLLLPWVYLWSVQSFSHVQHFVTPGTAAHQASLSITNSQSLLKLMSIEPSHPLWSSSPLAFNLSQHQGLFQWDLHIRWPKYCSCSFSIGPSNEYLGLISFRIYWFDLLTVKVKIEIHEDFTHMKMLHNLHWGPIVIMSLFYS